MPKLRTFLVLGRVSNLSTVWSNVFCAWIIAGGASWAALLAVMLGASLLYVGGMFMNDLRDAEFDARHRPERPIPSGAITVSAVRAATLILCLAGFACIAWLGIWPAAFALLLVGLIAAYNLVHKSTSLAPLLMAGCRAVLYPMTAAAVAPELVDNLIAIAAGTAFVYICGVSYLARSESTDNRINPWALALLVAPLLAAFYFRIDLYEPGRGIAISLLALWMGLAFWRARHDGRIVVGRTIGPLLAAIPLLDLLILSCFGFVEQSGAIVFAAFFAIAWAAQRVIPAS